MKRPPRTAFPPGVFVWPCGCTLDHPNGDEVCEEHRHTSVVREGASLRTGDELGRQFLDDALDLLTGPATAAGLQVTPATQRLLERLDADFVDGGWLDDDTLREEMTEHERLLEDQLVEHGWSVDWNVGYVIWRPTGDAPARELAAKREQESHLDG